MTGPTNKQIHKALLVVATAYPLDAERKTPIVNTEQVLKLGTLVIRCLPIRENILAVAAKYEREVNFITDRNCLRDTQGTKPRPASSTYAELLNKGEYQEAVDFWILRHDAPFFGQAEKEPMPLVIGKEFTPGFVTARTPANIITFCLQGWNVTHLASGMTCSCAAGNAKQARALFDKLDPAKLAKALEGVKGQDYQAIGRAHYGIEDCA